MTHLSTRSTPPVTPVIPAQAGIQNTNALGTGLRRCDRTFAGRRTLDCGLRRNDGLEYRNTGSQL